MGTTSDQVSINPAEELSEVKKHWWFFAVVGAAMIVLGVVAIGSPLVMTVVTVKLFGILFLMGGIVQIVSAFWAGKWSGFFLNLLTGVLYLVVGLLVANHPVENAVILTVLLAAFFMASGIVRIIISLHERFCNWGWSLLNGVVTLMLGMIIWSRLRESPEDSLWVIGLLIGIEMLFNGWAWVMLGFAVRGINGAEAEAK